ncbi:hypothetical protein DFP92_114109 [Yoonia sediminilitoris]|uniref:Uncharacterized protein n=1 Tax=Yoonia sediminilitoris TaxID=1286148 RepID=A0A2T6K995_9RHOB|nr:hypothetical protein C8N45_114108 [Yoonia sediminilitoris]RCW91150.1 hypothetical protein DFP92_114109 [Yoonia sediminilitoris]
MMKRFLRYRTRPNWGHIFDLVDDEYRSYADGTIRRFRHRRHPDGSKTREFVGSRKPTNADWAAFYQVMDRYEAWCWTTESFLPVMDGNSWSLRVVGGDREVRITGGFGFPPGFIEVSDAIHTLVHGTEGQLLEE